MVTGMHGKAARTIEVTRADGNPYIYSVGQEFIYKDPASVITSITLSATHHGDHDQFWVCINGAVGELARFNARSPELTTIIWE